MAVALTSQQRTAGRGPLATAVWLLAHVLLVMLIFAQTGCALPQWRVFQKKIDPKLAEKPAAQIEAEKRSAALIADLSATPSANPVARIAEIHAIAVPLSASLGEPLKRATVFEAPAVIAESRAGLLAAQARAEQWKTFARKYAGTPLEDTGLNLAGPAGLLGVVGIAAACIACPAFGYLLLRVLPLLWGFFSRTTSAVAEFAQANPQAATELADTLSIKMDAAHKALVKRHARRISDLVPSPAP